MWSWVYSTLRLCWHTNNPSNHLVWKQRWESVFRNRDDTGAFSLFGISDNFLGLFKPILFKLWLLTKILFFSLGPLIILVTLKKSLELIITVEESLELLKTPQGFSNIPLMMWSIRLFLLDPHLCGFRVLILLTNYRVSRYFSFIPHTYSWHSSWSNYYRNLWATVDTFLFFCPLTYDDFL